jgi:putative transposase
MDERLRFVARLLEGEKMTPLCREFGISRVTGYKIFNRCKECGLDALNCRSSNSFGSTGSKTKRYIPFV